MQVINVTFSLVLQVAQMLWLKQKLSEIETNFVIEETFHALSTV